MKAVLYFVAYYKHDAPQHLVAGPFVDYDTADLARATRATRTPTHPNDQYVVVESQPMTFTHVC